MKNKSNINQVYISHEKNDDDIKKLAEELSKELERRGFKVWSEKYISSGEEWTEHLKLALKTSDAMIALLDQYSYSSSYVRNEIEHAFFDDKYKYNLLPVLLKTSDEETFSKIPWFLEKLNYIEISKKQSIKKSVENIANHFQNFISRKENANA